MSAFTLASVTAIRGALRSRWTMRALCAALPTWTRDQIVEAIDATRRFQDDYEALIWANNVLEAQSLGKHLINGRVVW